MPKGQGYASDAQRRLFHARPDLAQYTAERDKEAKGKKLPERLHPVHAALAARIKKYPR